MLPLLGLLAVAVGLPFLVVSTTAPLLQRWLAATSHPAAADPYHHDDSPDTDASDWVVMAKSGRDLRAVVPVAGGWQDCARSSGTSVWTDDFSNLLTAIDLDG